MTRDDAQIAHRILKQLSEAVEANTKAISLLLTVSGTPAVHRATIVERTRDAERLVKAAGRLLDSWDI
jgi:hypothetical protein